MKKVIIKVKTVTMRQIENGLIKSLMMKNNGTHKSERDEV